MPGQGARGRRRRRRRATCGQVWTTAGSCASRRTARTIETVADTGGRPLGIEIDPGGDLRICDAHLRRAQPRSRAPAQLTHGRRQDRRRCRWCSATTARWPRDGTVYFSDSSTKFGIEHYRGELFEHTGDRAAVPPHPGRRGRPASSDGFQFANGVALAPDESWVAVAQTTAYSLDRIWLTGPSAGRREPFVDEPARVPGQHLHRLGRPDLGRAARAARPDPRPAAARARRRCASWPGRMPHKLQPHEKQDGLGAGLRQRRQPGARPADQQPPVLDGDRRARDRRRRLAGLARRAGRSRGSA